MVDKYEDPFVRIASMIGGDEYLKVARSLLKAEDATDEERQIQEIFTGVLCGSKALIDRY